MQSLKNLDWFECYLYTFAEKSSNINTIAVLRLDDNENGINVLSQNGFTIVESFK